MSDSEGISDLITAFGGLCISDRVPSSGNDDGEASESEGLDPSDAANLLDGGGGNVHTAISTPGEGNDASTSANTSSYHCPRWADLLTIRLKSLHRNGRIHGRWFA
jgi:hypothetical protein